MSTREDILIASAAVVLIVAILGVSSTVPSASATSHTPSDVIASEPVEPNDGFGNATNVTDGYYRGLNITNADFDFYAVELDDGDELEASIYFSHDTGDLDMRVYDGSQDELDRSTSASDNETITLAPETGGTYFLRVSGFENATAPYDLEIRTSSGLADAVCSLFDTEAPPGTTVFLDASASENVDLYTYYKGDGDGDPDAESDRDFRSFTYNESGTYQPRVEAQNFSDGSRDVAECGELVIDANENPNANLTYSPKQPAPGETVTFDPSGTSDPDGDRIRTWEWDLDGDGTYEDIFDLGGTRERNFSDPGTYTVGLRVTDDHDAVDETTVTVEVPNEEPSASFSYQPESPVQVGEEVTFDASASADPDGEIVEYRWNFDGDDSIDRNGSTVTYSYDAAGPYVPTLTVVDDSGATNVTSRDVTVESEPLTCSVEPQEVVVGEQITVQAGGGGATGDIEVDFQGDGFYNDTTTDGTVTHRYESAGGYVVLARADTETGTVRDECGEVTVAENQPPENQPPEAQLTVTPSQPQPGENVTLNASGSTDPDGEIVEYRWDFDGDDSIDATRNESTVTHSYDAAGSYVPTLTVVDDSGATTATSRDVTVEEPLTCSVEPQEVVVGEQITVQAGGGGAVDEIEVDFQGDESYDDTTTDGTVTHRYESAGGYVVLARADTTAGPEVVECGDVRVTENQPPVARLNVTPSQPRPGENVTLDASESSDPDGRIAEYRWDLDGDGTIDRTTNASSTTVEYTEDTQLDPAVTVIDDAGATGNASEPIQPFGARCTVDPRNVSVGDTVTIDASDSKAGFAAQFDVDGDGEYEYERDALSVQYAYNESGSYAPRVLVIGETREVLVDCPSIDVTVAENQPPVARLNVTPSQPEPGENVTLDAGESSDPDGDGTIDRTTNASSTTVEYTEDTQLDPAVTVIDDAGATGNASQPVDTEDAGFGFPVDPEGAAGLLGLLGFGGVSYYLYASSAGVGAGGSGSKSRPPRPPKQLPESHGLAHIETGTVSTPIESGSVSVTGLGFEPDLILLSASNVTPEEGADPATDRTDGWAHGKVRRAEDGTLLQSTMTLADDDLNMDAGIGGANDGHALELLVHYDDPPERVLGSVTSTTTDGFEISFDTSGLRENHSEAEFTVLYKAFGFQGDPQVSVGHFRTPDVPGTQTIDLGINADHVVLFATNTIDDVDSYLMTDLPLGFSVGDVIGHGAEPAQLVRTATADPSVANSVAYAAYDDRALHLQYGYDGTIRGRTTATVTALAEGQMNLEYQKVYHGPNKLGSTDSKLVSYVAMNTGDVQPAIGHFRLPEPGSEEALAVELGFRPSMIEFQSFAIHEMNAEAVVDAPVSFGWSEGTVIADDNDIRHQVLDQTIGASMPPAAGPRIDPGFAASVRTVADGGKITGRDEVTVTRLTESGFEMVVTDVGTDSRTGGERRPLVFYKAWPQPIGSDSG